MLSVTNSRLTQRLDSTEIQRVESLMQTPFHLLSIRDREYRVTLGAQRSKEALSSVPFYANRAHKAAQENREWEYWSDLWRSGVNFLHPAKVSSTAGMLEAA